MQKVVSGMVTFVIVFLLSAWLYHSNEVAEGLVTTFIKDQPSVPLIALPATMLIHLATLALILHFFRHMPAGSAAFPRLWIETFEVADMSRRWETLSAIATLLVPPFGFTYLWARFLKGEAWGKDNYCPVGLWTGRPLDPACLPQGQIRYGWLDTARVTDPDHPRVEWDGADYFPPLQPWIYVLLTIAVLALSLIVFRRWRDRAR